MTCWIAEDDWAALARVALGPECGEAVPDEDTLSAVQLAAAREAVAAASQILQSVTGSRVHGAGVAVDEFSLFPGTKRLRLTQQPVRKLLTIERVTDCETTELDGTACQYMLFNGAVFFSPTRQATYRQWEYQMGFPCRGRSFGLIRVEYLFGSTLSAAGRNAVLTLARELYLAGPCGDINECSLPERAISVTREGVSYTLLDTQAFYDQGRLGLPVVDQWLASLKLVGRANAQVVGPDAPPGSNVSIECRPRP